MNASPLLGLWLLGGCASAEYEAAHVYSPSEVLAATKELAGREIVVRGWLGGCDPNENRPCGIYSNRRAAAGLEALEWPLPIEFDDEATSVTVREVLARGAYVVTCRNSETTICVEYDGFFQVASIED